MNVKIYSAITIVTEEHAAFNSTPCKYIYSITYACCFFL